jgi:hypothetical protein
MFGGAPIGFLSTVLAVSPFIKEIPAEITLGLVNTGAIIGGTIGFKIIDDVSKNVWIEQTERHTYKAPTGHFIYADPTY